MKIVLYTIHVASSGFASGFKQFWDCGSPNRSFDSKWPEIHELGTPVCIVRVVNLQHLAPGGAKGCTAGFCATKRGRSEERFYLDIR